MDFNQFNNIQVIESSFVIKNGGQDVRVIEQRVVQAGNRLMLEIFSKDVIKNIAHRHPREFQLTLYDEENRRVYIDRGVTVEKLLGESPGGSMLRLELTGFPFIFLQKALTIEFS